MPKVSKSLTLGVLFFERVKCFCSLIIKRVFMRRFIKFMSLVSVLFVSPTYAAEGTYEAMSMGEAAFNTIETADGSLMMGKATGTGVITTGTGLFKPNMTSEWTCLTSAVEEGGAKVIQANCELYYADIDSTVFIENKRKTGDIGSENSKGAGLVKITGGTGQFSGISGSCDYSIQYIKVTKSVTKMSCSYSI